MAVRLISTRLAIEGEQEYKQKIASVNSELKTLDSELKLVESQFKGQANSMEALTAKGTALQNVYDKQADKARELEAALKNAQSAQQAYAERIETSRSKIAATETALDKLKNSTNDTTEEQKKLVAELNKLQKELEESTAGEAAAAKGVNNWQQQLNSAKIRLNSLNDEIQKNDRYLDEAQKSTDKCAKSIDEYGKEVKDAAEESNLLAKIFAGGFFANIATQALSWVTSKIKELASAAFDTADELMKMSDVTGRSVEELQQLQYVADDVGVSLETITSAQTRFTRAMGDAQRGSERQVEAFRKLNIEYKNSDGSLRSSTEVMYEAFDALSKIGNETERDAVALELFGRSAMELNPLIKAGSDGLKKLADEAKRSGAVMSEDAVEALDAFGDAVDHVKQRAQAFVGEALSKIIGSGKTATETIEDLVNEMSDTSGVLDLIDKYRELSTELDYTNLSKEVAAAKNAELEQTKHDLIAASDGVITALDLENGTFDEQVNVLERATRAQQDYNQYQLEAIVLENTGAKAREKAEEVQRQYNATQEARNELLEKQAELIAKIESGNSEGNAWGKYEDQLETVNELIDSLNTSLAKNTEKMAEVEANTNAAEEALRILVNNGFITAEEAAKKFGLTTEELAEILGTAATSAMGLTKAEKEAQEIIADLTTQINDLQTAYNEAYKAAYDSITSQIGLWEEMDNSVIKSAAEIQKALESQMRWLDNYNTNLTKLSKRQVEGVDELVKSLSDGSTESAAILAGLSIASDEEISKIIKSMKRVNEGKDSLSHTMAEALTDFDKKIEDLSEKTSGAVNALNNKAAAQEAALDTMKGYIDQILKMIPDLEKTYRKAARAANQAYRDELDMHSPSRKAMEASADYFEGLILGAERKQAELERTFAEAAYAADSATRVSLPESTAQLGTQIANAMSSVLGQSGGAPQINVYVEVPLDGRQLAKGVRVYLEEESALAGIDLTEV
jgi:chromosome segregation ATPase